MGLALPAIGQSWRQLSATAAHNREWRGDPRLDDEESEAVARLVTISKDDEHRLRAAALAAVGKRIDDGWVPNWVSDGGKVELWFSVESVRNTSSCGCNAHFIRSQHPTPVTTRKVRSSTGRD